MADIQTALPTRITDSTVTNQAQITTLSGGSLQVDIANLLADDAAFTIGTSEVFPMGALADETTPDSVNEGDVGLVRMTLTRLLKTKLIGDDSGTDVSIAANSSGQLLVSVVSSLTGLADDAAFTIGTTNVYAMGALADDTAPDSVDEGDIGTPRMTLDRKLLTRVVGATDANRLDVNASGQALVRDAADYAEDAAHGSGDIGQFVLAVRNDANTSLVGTDGDYAPLQVDANGRLKVDAEFTSAFDFAEDSPHTTGDQGAFVLAVRNDANTSLVGTDGDYAPLQVDSDGRLKVSVSGGGSAPSAVDDSAFSIGSGNVSPIGALADDTATDSVDEGDVGLVRMTLDRKLLTRVVGATDTSRLDVTSSGEALAQINSSFVDDAAFTVATSRVNAMGALADETAPDSVDEGDIGIPRMTLTRLLKTKLIADNSGTDVNVAATSAGSVLVVNGNEISGTRVHEFVLEAAVANASESTTLSYTAGGATFYLTRVLASASGGPCRARVLVDSTEVARIYWSTSSPFAEFVFDPPIAVATTDVVDVIIQNNAGSAQDVNALIQGIQS